MKNQYSTWKMAMVLAAALLLTSGVALAAIPSVTQIEGALTATGGGPVSDGDYAMTFLLYKDAQGGSAVWSEGPVNVAVAGGAFSHDLGTSTPMTQDVLEALAGQGFLAMKISNDPELSRKPLRSAMFALRASAAEALDCSGCITAAQLDAGILQPYAKTASLATVATTGKFSDLQGGPDLSAYAKTAALAAVASTGAYADLEGAPDTSVFAKAADLAKVATSGKYTDLTATPTLAKLDATCGTGLVIKGLKADGSYECVQSMDPAGLPADGIDELSNGLIWNQFTDVFASAAALAIPDNNPIGGFSEIVVGDVGLAQKLTVSIELANSDISAVQISLYDSANQEYVLYNKGGKKGDGIKTSYPDPTKTISGDLTYWVGKNPKGTWRLKVIDTAFLNNTTDGQVVAWSVNLQTLSSKKIQIKGDLIVDGTITNPALAAQIAAALPKPPTYRFKMFSTYDKGWSWFMSNETELFGGVNPSNWSDGGADAWNFSSDKVVLRRLFNEKSWASDRALVCASTWETFNDSSSGRHCAVLFRVKNATANAINWTMAWRYTSYGSWGEHATCALNGVEKFHQTGDCWAGNCGDASITYAIPANRVSTVICINGSGPAWGYGNYWGTHYYRSLLSGFNSLTLPAGLQFVDDLDTAANGWEQ
jgi:subtilisin-like proprotein convertase family protein